MKHQSFVGYASVIKREGDVVCTGGEGWVVDHGKSPVFNVRVHMKDTVIVCVCGRQGKMCTSDFATYNIVREASSLQVCGKVAGSESDPCTICLHTKYKCTCAGIYLYDVATAKL